MKNRLSVDADKAVQIRLGLLHEMMRQMQLSNHSMCFDLSSFFGC